MQSEPSCESSHEGFSMTETMRRYLTRKKMEEFFQDDELFWHATAELFKEMEVSQ